MARSTSYYEERTKFEAAHWERLLRSFAPFRGTAPVRAALPGETTCTACGMAILGPVLPTRVTLVDRPRRPHNWASCVRGGGLFDSFHKEDYCGGMAYHLCIYPDLPYRTDSIEDLQEYWVSDTPFTVKGVSY